MEPEALRRRQRNSQISHEVAHILRRWLQRLPEDFEEKSASGPHQRVKGTRSSTGTLKTEADSLRSRQSCPKMEGRRSIIVPKMEDRRRARYPKTDSTTDEDDSRYNTTSLPEASPQTKHQEAEDFLVDEPKKFVYDNAVYAPSKIERFKRQGARKPDLPGIVEATTDWSEMPEENPSAAAQHGQEQSSTGTAKNAEFRNRTVCLFRDGRLPSTGKPLAPDGKLYPENHDVVVAFTSLEKLKKLCGRVTPRQEYTVNCTPEVGDARRLYCKTDHRYVTWLAVTSKTCALTMENLELAFWCLRNQAETLGATRVHVPLDMRILKPVKQFEILLALERQFLSAVIDVHIWHSS